MISVGANSKTTAGVLLGLSSVIWIRSIFFMPFRNLKKERIYCRASSIFELWALEGKPMGAREQTGASKRVNSLKGEQNNLKQMTIIATRSQANNYSKVKGLLVTGLRFYMTHSE